MVCVSNLPVVVWPNVVFWRAFVNPKPSSRPSVSKFAKLNKIVDDKTNITVFFIVFSLYILGRLFQKRINIKLISVVDFKNLLDFTGIMMSLFKYILFASCLLLVVGCSQDKLQWVVINHENGSCFVPISTDTIMDMPQDLELFRSQMRTQEFQTRQKQLNAKFDEIYFSPWNTDFKFDEPKIFSGGFYCENLQKLSSADVQIVRNNIYYRKPVNQKAVIVRNAMVKFWPTDSQLFEDIMNPGDSYPFDSNINSLIKLGTPVRLQSISQDGLWGYISCYAFSGWISLHDLAYVDEKFIREFASYKNAVAVNDGAVIKYKNRFFNRADMGTILPYDGKCILCPHKKADGFAEIVRCVSSDFRGKPFEFSADNVMHICKQFLRQKYGWGGYLNSRDCSMLTMDFCTVFGIPMERDSSKQLSEKYCLELPQDRSAFIMQKGVPFLTLVGKKGHVMLYVGVYKKCPVFLHNVWGIPKIQDLNNRYVLGKTVLTSSQFGADVIPGKTVKLEDTITIMRIL